MNSDVAGTADSVRGHVQFMCDWSNSVKRD